MTDTFFGLCSLLTISTCIGILAVNLIHQKVGDYPNEMTASSVCAGIMIILDIVFSINMFILNAGEAALILMIPLTLLTLISAAAAPVLIIFLCILNIIRFIKQHIKPSTHYLINMLLIFLTFIPTSYKAYILWGEWYHDLFI